MPEIFRFSYSYFSSLDWKWVEGDCLAESSASVRAWINETCPEEFRIGDQRYVSTGKRNIDTLVIEDDHHRISLPYQLPKTT